MDKVIDFPQVQGSESEVVKMSVGCIITQDLDTGEHSAFFALGFVAMGSQDQLAIIEQACAVIGKAVDEAAFQSAAQVGLELELVPLDPSLCLSELYEKVEEGPDGSEDNEALSC